MNKRKNEFGIKCLIMSPAFRIVDPKTQASLQLRSTVEFFAGEYLPDFLEAHTAIQENINTKTLTLEAAASTLVDLFNNFEPKGIKVKLDVINNNSFFPVSVVYENGLSEVEGEDKKKPVKKDSAKKPGKKEEGKEDKPSEPDTDDDEGNDDD